MKMLHWLALIFAQSFIAPVEPVAIAGEVLSPEGIPVPFAQVVLVSEPPFGVGETFILQTQCNEKGLFRFQIKRPLDSPAFVIAFQKGYGLGWVKTLLTASTQCTVRLNRPATLSGILHSFPCKPLTIKGLRPMGFFSSHYEPFQLRDFVPDFLRAQTDADGNFSFSDLPDNCIAVLEISDPPCQFEVPVTEGLELKIPPTGLIVGKVVRRNDGNPLSNVEIVLKPTVISAEKLSLTASPVKIRTVADANGQFHARVPEWDWLVWLLPKGDAEWVSVPQVVQVRGGEVKTVLLQAQRPGIVRGWVADAKTRFPLTRLFVFARLVRPVLSSLPHAAIFSEVARQLPEGAYELRLPDGVWELKVADEGWESESIIAELVEGAVLEAPWIFVRPFPTVKVFVTDEHGNPTKALLVDNWGKIGETDERGFTQWQVPTDQTIIIAASSPDKNFWSLKSLAAKQDEVKLKLRKGEKISGILVDVSGQPETGALVSVWVKFQQDSPEICLLSQRTGKDGNFQFIVPVNASMQLRAQKGTKLKQTDWGKPHSFGFVKLVLK